MKTGIIGSDTDGVLALDSLHRTGTAFRATAMNVLTPGRHSLSDETDSPQPVVLPDGPELWRLYQQEAGSHTENALVELYLPLVRSILNRLAGTLTGNIDRDGLQSAGLLGLLDALRKFDFARGVPFYGYARLRIRGAMLDEIRRMDWVPRAVHDKSRKLQETVNRLERQLGRMPTKTEIADAMKITMAEYDELLDEIRPVQFVWLDSDNDIDPEKESFVCEGITHSDQVGLVEQVSASELKRVIFERLNQMPEIQRKVMTLYYLEGLYLREIAVALGLTEGRICQIKIQAISSIRAYLERYENETTRGCNAAGSTEPTAAKKKTSSFRKIRDKEMPPPYDFDGCLCQNSKLKATTSQR
jgi:RNA polymerase sigma factor for flagellar operon FliA